MRSQRRRYLNEGFKRAQAQSTLELWTMYTRNLLVLIILAACSSINSGAPTVRSHSVITTQPSPTTIDNAKTTTQTQSLETLNFMQRFGYLPKAAPDMELVFTQESVAAAIREMQKFGGIPQTGVLDNQTLTLMVTPRCGVADVARNDSNEQANPLSSRRRSKRFVVGSEGWRKRTVTYFIANWSPKIGQYEMITEMRKAFQTWADYSRLKFIEINDPNADIIVAFGRGNHHDGYPFDGPGSILAHAFYPYEMSSYGGDVHFDDDEAWKLKLDGPFDDGVDFLTVAVHELGHSLGLAHSPVPDSVMFPYFKGYNPNSAQLGYDDILAMYQLYISRRLEEDEIIPLPQPETPHFVPDEREKSEETTHSVPDEREKSKETENEEEISNEIEDSEEERSQSTRPTPTFEGDYETVDSHRRKFGASTPVLTSEETWSTEDVIIHPVTTERPSPSEPMVNHCDGNYDALSVIRGELFVFKKNFVWRLKYRGTIENGYPVPIKQMFWQLPDNFTVVDAIYERPTDGNIVIFSGPNIWITDGNKLLEGSPKPLSSLGLPRHLTRVDAAMVWGKNQKTYIFSGDDYWRYDEYAKHMEPDYPANIAERWRGVPSNIDAVMTFTDGMTYFFKGSDFWRFDNTRIQTDQHYPLPSPQVWLDCPEIPDNY